MIKTLQTELIESEIAILRKISSPHIVQLYDCWPLAGGYYMQLELIEVEMNSEWSTMPGSQQH